MNLPSPRCRRLPLLFLFSLAEFFVFADTHYVSETGSDLPPYTSWETAATSIQAAIDAACEGDIVLIAPGVFCENLLMQKSLIVKGAGADLTVIGGRPGKDGYCRSDGNPRLACVNVSNVWFEALTVAGGRARENGGGILIRGSANVVIRECEITGNRVDLGSGAGVYVEDSKQVSLLNCAVTDNRIDSYEGGSGGGIFAVGSEVSIRSCLIRGNSAREAGGGVFLGCSGRVCSIVHSEIVANIAVQACGGGIACYCLGEITGCIIASNQAQGDGGGLWCCDAMHIQGSVICNNRAEARGGGVYYCGNPGGRMTNSLVASNWSQTRNAEGIYWEANANVINCTIAYHSDSKGSTGLQVALPAETYGTYENITNCIFFRNSYDAYGCGSTYSLRWSKYGTEGEGNIEDDPHFHVYATREVESVVYDHLEATTTITCKEPVGDDNLYRRMLVQIPPYGPSFPVAGNEGNELLCYGSVPADIVGTTLEITDFSLSENSPCIDAGNNDADYIPETDKTGAFRIFRGRDDWRVDMGAYEYGSRRFEISSIQSTAEPEHLKITWNSQPLPGKTYSIYFSPDLLTWAPAGSNIPSQGDTTSWIDPYTRPLVQRFYQVSSP